MSRQITLYQQQRRSQAIILSKTQMNYYQVNIYPPTVIERNKIRHIRYETIYIRDYDEEARIEKELKKAKAGAALTGVGAVLYGIGSGFLTVASLGTAVPLIAAGAVGVGKGHASAIEDLDNLKRKANQKQWKEDPNYCNEVYKTYDLEIYYDKNGRHEREFNFSGEKTRRVYK